MAPDVLVGAPGPLAEGIAGRLAATGGRVVTVGFGSGAAFSARHFDTPADGEGWPATIGEIVAAYGAPRLLVDIASYPAGYGQNAGDVGSYVGAVLSRAAHCVNAARPAMARERSGSVVLVGLPMGAEAVTGMPAAGALGGALLGLVRGLAVALGDDGIRVNLCSPGLIRLAGVNDGQTPGDGFGIVPLHRAGGEAAGSPADVAEAVAFLGSEDAAYMTGSQLVVDGGLSACRSSKASVLWGRGTQDALERAFNRHSGAVTARGGE